MGCDVFDALVAVGTMISAGCSAYLVGSKFLEGKPHIQKTGSGFKIVNISKNPITIHKIKAVKGYMFLDYDGPVDIVTGQPEGEFRTYEQKKLNKLLYTQESITIYKKLVHDGTEYTPEVRLKRHLFSPNRFDIILMPSTKPTSG